ncbi:MULTISPECIES: helix-turn-helix domain-containing protein [Streptomyces]
MRCRITLECATGAPNTDVAALLGVEEHTVGKWRARFVRNRLEGPADEPRPSGPRKITDAQMETAFIKPLKIKPKDATHWSTRSMAREAGFPPVGHHTYLADLPPHTAPGAHLQAVEGPAVHREAPRYGWPVSRPARTCADAVWGRKDADPGAGSVGSAAPDDAGPASAVLTVTCAAVSPRCPPR